MLVIPLLLFIPQTANHAIFTFTGALADSTKTTLKASTSVAAYETERTLPHSLWSARLTQLYDFDRDRAGCPAERSS